MLNTFYFPGAEFRLLSLAQSLDLQEVFLGMESILKSAKCVAQLLLAYIDGLVGVSVLFGDWQVQFILLCLASYTITFVIFLLP